MTILVIGFVVVALALVAVVVSATQVHLERTRLAALADLAALDAAEQVSDEAYFAPSSGTAPSLAPPDADVAATVTRYLADHPDPAARWTALTVLDAGSPDGRTVHVRLGAVVRPAWTGWLPAPFADGIAIEASSDARAW